MKQLSVSLIQIYFVSSGVDLNRKRLTATNGCPFYSVYNYFRFSKASPALPLPHEVDHPTSSPA
nr:MAG TPA: hypothetical protein [Caudoviricetes sp.]